MKKYHVYGIGNALVDMEFEVEPSFLEKMKVEKGLMTLVDQERQTELLNNLEGVSHDRSCGGSAANTIIAVSQLGGKAFYSCKVANDETGEFYYKDLVGNGVTTNMGESREEGVSGKCMVFITPDADRTMNSFLGITETFSTNELVEEELINSEYLYIEGYLVTSPTGKAAAIKAREIAHANDVKVALTFSDPGIVGFFKDGFKEIIGDKKVDLLFCNEAEAMSFTDSDNIDTAVNLLKSVAKSFAVTMGDKGAIIYDGEREMAIETKKVVAKDTNGAGDLFAGAFLYGITNGMEYNEAAKLACHSSSELVTQFGARLTKEQVLTVKESLL
ncbi:putative Pfk family kinase [Halobacteriovorax marinus SJ]|uniref:Pfk family kinase n=1 Tax=Halobacteriovorax marinus (strain ATCC BAA-682 / DSM 15412 / SJ) TaxID=862908 RepID=E1X1Z7_HALMS|nr:adenosine kinase [Halobacteriovorax marinus]CBW26657.1 putative Pfk family kinase [Halobacteriovorax marinus SJ]